MKIFGKYKKSRTHNFFYWSLIFSLIFFCAINIFSDRLISDDLPNITKTETILEEAVNDVVGISSFDGNNSKWGSGVIVSKNRIHFDK